MSTKLLVLDNYDSFTYNLVHLMREILPPDATLDVIRNDKITLDDVDAYDKILLSPGPGIPEEAGIMPDLLKRYAPSKSILGVCLGHQAIAEAFGGTLFNMRDVVHGKHTPVHLDTSEPLFARLPRTIQGGRYHSWLVEPEGLPACLQVCAKDDEENIMALSHVEYDVRGIQFHPESVLTPEGRTILENWYGSA